jgi:hypothetical protein
MKKLSIIAILACIIATSGCARTLTKSTTSASPTGTNSTYYHSAKQDALLTKVVRDKEAFIGIRLHILGSSSMSPATFDLGRGTHETLTIPTATRQIYTAPFASHGNDNIGWFNQDFDDSTSTATGLLPAAAYNQPTINTSNPLLISVVGTNGQPLSAVPVTVSTNSPAANP